ncbi:nucleoside hydrolase-like [Cydia pomonella]|uniref:nucleoside hydrolase-like n=1 Tax=Cydia pomonella TaxID=82600 RepID=UPI002ADDB172|nr:nucleoside hydrolase-like [Cydia pomonella]XP_061709176.1 nucleoside hydrolase-like [Cydia pomonella]
MFLFAVLIILSLSCVFANESSPLKKSKLIIDNDAGGDDAVAIFLALLYEKHFNESQLLALTTVNGNTIESNVCINNQRILKVAKRQNIPIYRGAKDSLLKDFQRGNYYGDDGLGDSGEQLIDLLPAQEKNAVSALIDLTKTHPGEVTVITLGPLTNIALAIRLDPEFISRLAHLYIGAGHIHDGANPDPEFNARMDPEAYHIVLENLNPDKTTLLPFSQVKKDLDFSKDWRQNVLGAIDNDAVKAINKYEQVSMKKNERWRALDPAVIAIAIMPDIVDENRYSRNKIILNGEKRGINTNDFVEKDKANVRIATNLNKEQYRKFIFNVFSAEK